MYTLKTQEKQSWVSFFNSKMYLKAQPKYHIVIKILKFHIEYVLNFERSFFVSRNTNETAFCNTKSSARQQLLFRKSEFFCNVALQNLKRNT